MTQVFCAGKKQKKWEWKWQKNNKELCQRQADIVGLAKVCVNVCVCMCAYVCISVCLEYPLLLTNVFLCFSHRLVQLLGIRASPIHVRMVVCATSWTDRPSVPAIPATQATTVKLVSPHSLASACHATKGPLSLPRFCPTTWYDVVLRYVIRSCSYSTISDEWICCPIGQI